MNKFKVGDDVRVKEGLIIGETYGETLLLKGMVDKKPYESKIIAVMKENLGFAYRLENLYWYSEEMIELFKTTHKTPHQELLDLGWVEIETGGTLAYVLNADGSLHPEIIELSLEGKSFYTTLRIINLQLAKILVRYLEELE